MENLYKRIVSLCEKKGVKESRLCADIGKTKSLMSGLKSGKVKSISLDNAVLIADYFGVSLDFLAGRTQKRLYDSLGDIKKTNVQAGVFKEEHEETRFDCNSGTFFSRHPISLLSAIYGIDSNVLSEALQISKEHASLLLTQFETGTDEELRKAAQFFCVSERMLLLGEFPAATSEIVRDKRDVIKGKLAEIAISKNGSEIASSDV